MAKSLPDTFRRFLKHLCFSLFGTGTDALVLWICSDFLLHGYVGEVIVSPVISFECGNIVNFLVASHFVWGDRMKGKTLPEYLRRFIGFNLSYSSVFLIKTGLLIVIQKMLGWDVVICNILAMMFAGIINFLMNDNVIFKNRKESLFDGAFNAVLAFLTQVLLRPRPIFLDESMSSGRLPGPCIIISNHTCHLDGVVLNTVFRRTCIHTLAAKDRFEQKGFGFFLRHTRCIPIDRMHADTSWIHEALKVLKEGDSVAIYPEGRHGKYRDMLPFHPGVMLLAQIAHVPLVLVYMDSPFRFFRSSGLVVSGIQQEYLRGGAADAEAIQKTTADIQLKIKGLMDYYIALNKR